MHSIDIYGFALKPMIVLRFILFLMRRNSLEELLGLLLGRAGGAMYLARYYTVLPKVQT